MIDGAAFEGFNVRGMKGRHPMYCIAKAVEYAAAYERFLALGGDARFSFMMMDFVTGPENYDDDSAKALIIKLTDMLSTSAPE